MNEIVLPDPLAPLLAGLNAFTQSLQEAQVQQQKLEQRFILCQQELQDSIEHVLEKDEAVRELERKSENLGKEISGVMFINEEEDLVEEIFVDSIGDLTSVDLDLVKLPSDPSLKVYSFHSHPRYENLEFSEADMSVIKTRTWESGHCIISEVGGEMRASCFEL